MREIRVGLTLAIRLSTLLSILLSILASCGGGKGRPFAAIPPATPEAACQAYAEALCERSETCEPFYFSLGYPDRASCIRQVTRTCPQQFDLPGTGDSPAVTAACGDVIAGTSCATWRRIDDLGCDYPAGSFDDGTPCYAYTQCKSSYCSYPDFNRSGCGVCAKVRGEGELCAADYVCGPHLRCVSTDGTSANTRCRRIVAIGAACGDDVTCERDAFCGATGMCQKKKGLNAPCESSDECETAAASLWCADNICRPSKLARTGEDCVADSTGPFQGCSGGGTCTADENNICRPTLLEGDPCVPDSPGTCEYSLECLRGVCVKQRLPVCQ